MNTQFFDDSKEMVGSVEIPATKALCTYSRDVVYFILDISPGMDTAMDTT